MNTATLERVREHATVTVQYVNAPKGNAVSGSIKDANGDYYGVHKSALAMFAPGQTYEFDFSVNGAGFRDIDTKTIQPIAPAAKAAPRAVAHGARDDVRRSEPVSPGNGNNYYRPTHPRDAERMFVTATLGHFIDTGRVECMKDHLVAHIKELRAAWQETFGKDCE